MEYKGVRIYFKTRDEDEWQEIKAESVEFEYRADVKDVEPLYCLPRNFEISCTLTWWDRWAFALPPAGMLPMYN